MNLLRHARLGSAAVFSFFLACSSRETPDLAKVQTGQTTQAFTQTIPFDFDHGNIATDVIIPRIVPLGLQNVSGGDATIILHTTTLVTNAWFDAIAPYNATAIGVYSNLPRRPASEGLTNRNKNVAMLYAALRSLSLTMPHNVPDWRAMVSGLGFDPDDNSTDLTTPVGIGNVAGNAVVAARTQDGMNVLGDAGGRKYNRHPYDDSTGYEPFNTALDLKDPSRWQPSIATRNTGIFTIQKAVTPQYASTQPYALEHPERFQVEPPKNSDYQHHPARYRQQADEVLAASAGLTDELKMIAELFNNKFFSIGFVALFVTQSHGLSLDQFVQYDFLVNVAAFDGGIVTWKQKFRYDSVRPFSAIHFLYGDQNVTAWGGPGRGTVSDMKGKEWTSYLPVADHPEYPSGSACFCAAHAQASRRYLGSDTLGWPVPAARGSSVIEPGVTPASDIVITFPTWTDFADRCAQSRFNGGVHFKEAIEDGAEMCQPVGDIAFDFVDRHIRGAL